jgi:hypothetical protein
MWRRAHFAAFRAMQLQKMGMNPVSKNGKKRKPFLLSNSETDHGDNLQHVLQSAVYGPSRVAMENTVKIHNGSTALNKRYWNAQPMMAASRSLSRRFQKRPASSSPDR